MAADESRPQRTFQELAEALLECQKPGRKVDPPPVGLPDGWLGIDKTYQSGVHAGNVYTRFFGGPNFKHRGLLSVRAVVLRDAEDRGLDPQEEVTKYDRAKQERAEQRVKAREEAGVLFGEQREQASAEFRAKFDPLDGPTVQQFEGWTTKFNYLVKCQQIQTQYIEPNGKAWICLKDVECVLACKMRNGEDISDFIATARAKANPDLYYRQTKLIRNNVAAQGTKTLATMFSNINKANSETGGGAGSDTVPGDDAGSAPVAATGEATAGLETAHTCGAAEAAPVEVAPEPPSTPPQRSAGRTEQSVTKTPAGKRAQVPSTMSGLLESTGDTKKAKLAGDEKPAEFSVDNTLLRSSAFGLGYRTSKDLAARDGDSCAEWGVVVEGVDEGDGWVRIGSRFLPMRVRDHQVLEPLKPRSIGDAGEEPCAVTDVAVAEASAGCCPAEVASVPARASTEIEAAEACEAEAVQLLPPTKQRKLRRKQPLSAKAADEQAHVDQGGAVEEPKRTPARKLVAGLPGSRTPVEDAPTTSPAHDKVRFYVSTGSWCFDYYRGDKRARFQTSLAATNNDKEAAARITRRCYDAFEKGWERERVLRLRSELCKLHIEWSTKNEPQQYVPAPSYRAQRERRRRILAGEPVGPQAQNGGDALGFGARLASSFAQKLVAQRKAEDGIPVNTKKASAYQRNSKKAKLKSFKGKQHAAAKKSAAAAAASKQSADAGLPDAPADSLAHSQITWQESGKLWWFEPIEEDSRSRIHITIAACGGCRDTAARIARLCYAAAENGATREDILKLRNEQYRKVAPQAKQNRGGELFRNLHGEVVLVNPSAVVQKEQKNWSELEPSDVDVLSAEDIVVYEKEAKLSHRRMLPERITRLEQMAQRTTLPQFSQKSSGSGRSSRADKLEALTQMADLATQEEKKDFGPRFLQAFLALRPEERRIASGLVVAQLERVAQIKDADKFTIAERRARLKEKLWESRAGDITMRGPSLWKCWTRKSTESEASTAEASGAKAEAALAVSSKAPAIKEAKKEAEPAAGDSEEKTPAAVTPSPVQKMQKTSPGMRTNTIDMQRSKPCPTCNADLEWTDYAGGNYAGGLGWVCNSASGCGHNDSNVGKWRWFCRKCENDFCGPCFTRVLQSEVVAANAASAEMELDNPTVVEAVAVPALVAPAMCDEAPRVEVCSTVAGPVGDVEVAAATPLIEH